MKRIGCFFFMLYIVPAVIAGPMVARVQISSDMDLETLRSLGAGILYAEREGIADIVIEEKGLDYLRSAGYELSEIVPFSATGLDSIDPEFHTYEEFTQELQTLYQNYPSLCKLDSIGRAQQFPRTIWCMKISDNPQIDEDELEALFIGVHHASEVMGGETLLYMIERILTNYGIDPEITRWVNDYQIYFIPLMNPDGHFAVTSGINYFWRKNARDLNRNNIYYEFVGGTWWNDDTEGIDLNRNYDWHWINGGSSVPRNYYYRGAYPCSESETQAVCRLGAQHNFSAGISFHSYGDVVIYPWRMGNDFAPDQDVLNVFSDSLASRFICDNGAPFARTVSDGRSGQCRNWFYGARGGLFFCVELLPYPVFIPPGNQLAERTQRYYNGAKYILERLSGPGITGHLRDSFSGQPLSGVVEIYGRMSPQVRYHWNDPQTGRFTRLLNPGTYNLAAAARGYQVRRVENIVVTDTLTLVEILLTPTDTDESPEIALSRPREAIIVSATPNPFNASTDISFTLESAGFVKLTVYDITGREVASLVNYHQSPGHYEIAFDGTELANGVYFALLEAGGTKLAQKLLLVK